jgi:hypothetical protein
MQSERTIQRENLKRVTAMPFCCPNCGSNSITCFESPQGEWDHGMYHAWHREECLDCQTTFTTVLHPVWLEDVDVPTPEEAARRRQKHIDAGLHALDGGITPADSKSI